MNKFFTSAFMLVSFCFFANAQQYLNQPILQNRPAEKKVTFWDVEKAFNEYWKDKQRGETEGENASEGGYEQFKRWEAFMKQRTFPSGNFPSPEILFNEHLKFKNSDGYRKGINTAAANWSFLGPHVIPGSGGGSGRINCIAFDPNNSNIIWIGAACGGLWKSTDGGVTWATSNTDLLPSISISDIAIDPSNPQIMYLATGDKYGVYYQYEVWGHYSAGVLKSTDGGATWNSTGMNYTISNGALIQRLILDSLNTTILYAATNTGIFKTTNSGTSWVNVKAGKFYDIEMHPTNNQILYAGDSALVYRSTNGGTSWTSMGLTSNGRNSIAVTRAVPNAVYVWSSAGLSYSSNSGVSFTNRTDPTSYCTPYGYYDMVIDVSPVNQNVLVAGGLLVALSTNGGTTWTTVSDWNSFPAPDYVHADHHALSFVPGSSTKILACNDGGIFQTLDQCSTWTDLSNGIDIKQYYRFTNSFLTPTLMFAGAQDNGTDKITGLNTATRVYGADGEDCLVDFTNDNIVFVSSQGGNFQRSTDGGLSFSGMGASGCDWTSPIAMDLSNHNTMYVGGSSISKSLDNGVTWNTLPGAFDGSCMYSLEVSPSNGNYVYAATFGNIYRTTNGGTIWNSITGTLPVGSAAISGIAINGSNPDAVWVTLSGFSAGNKVYYTGNGGASWSNISGTLPNIPVNCVEYQNGSNDIVYIGTDLGVFYTDATLNNWFSYNTGLPNVIIDELEVYYPSSKLRAATFGRGIWESDLQISTLQNVDASAMTMAYPPTQTCDTSIAPVVTIRNAGVNTLTSVDLKYKMDAQPLQTYSWSGSLASLATASITLPVYVLLSGTHTLTAYTTNPNATTDQNNLNDTIVRTFTILANPVALQAPVQEGFVSAAFPPTNWTIENSSSLLSRSTAAGGFGNSAESMISNFYSISSGTDMLISSFLDFQNINPPIRLYFDVAYATYSPSYNDTLAVDLFDDCLASSNIVYKKGTTTLATAPPTTSVFVPLPTQWRTDTVNLDTMAGKPAMRVRFLAISGYGNQLYIDNINLSGTPVGVAPISNLTSQISVYPNPSSGKANVIISQFENLKMKGIEIYNVYGEKIYSAVNFQINSSSNFQIDLSSQPEGVYFLKVISEQNTVVKKIVISR
ncbi:MAG: T9SS type A sorting domain-containing protein [Bacteroidetes bacterium]|nr:T9SS type A sorting domain-containing protein [Bacteroidota bacterium]